MTHLEIVGSTFFNFQYTSMELLLLESMLVIMVLVTINRVFLTNVPRVLK